MSLARSEAVSARLAGSPVLDRVDFAVEPGEMIGLIGPNGAGKTTLLRVLAGLLVPAAGRVTFDGQPIGGLDRRALARRLAYLPQAGASAWPVAVGTFVMLGRQPHLGPWRGPAEADRRAVARAMEACDVAALAGRAVTALSGGERARVLLARALAGEPELLLADEPVAGLDPAHQLAVMAALAARVAAGAAAVVVMHDLTLAARFCGRLALLDGGRIVADGAPMAVLSGENLARTFGIDVHRGRAEGIDFVIPLRRVAAGPGHAPR